MRDDCAAACFHQQQAEGDAKLKSGDVQNRCDSQLPKFSLLYAEAMTEDEMCDAQQSRRTANHAQNPEAPWREFGDRDL